MAILWKTCNHPKEKDYLAEARQVACYLLQRHIRAIEISKMLNKGDVYPYKASEVIANALPYDRVLQRRLKKMGYDK